MPGIKPKPYVARTANYHASWRGQSGLDVRLSAPGELTGPLLPLAIYILRELQNPVGPIDDKRLAQEYFKQRIGFLRREANGSLTVRLKPFRAWVRRNYWRFTMGPRQEARYNEEFRHRLFMARLRDYAENGPHFHNPDRRAAWERSSGY